MTLGLAPYLDGFAPDGPVGYEWGPGSAMAALGSEHSALLKKLGELSFRAVLGLRAATGEWMVQRFSGLYVDVEHVQVNEALWAGSVDIRYLKTEAMGFPRENDDPVRGALQLSKTNAYRIADAYPDAGFGAVRYLVGSVNLLRYVLPDRKAFDRWFKVVVPRVASLSGPSARVAGGFDWSRTSVEPRGVDPDIFGTPVPREAFDPSFDLAGVDVAGLIDAMLVKIGSEPNPFLRTAEELAEIGFASTPYRYLEEQ